MLNKIKAKMKQLDLNLLKVLVTLLEVKNTRKASELLHLSQPAVSRALNRLREFFNDELFVRSPHGLEPTAKALEIGLKLPHAMDLLIESVTEGVEFEPEQYQGKVTLAMNGFIANWVTIPLLHRIFEQAPQAELTVINWETDTPKKILNGEIQFGINYFPIDLSKQLIQMKLGEDEFVMVCRKDHPITEKEITKQHLEKYPLASLIISNWNADKAYMSRLGEKLGIKVHIKFRSNWLNLILTALKATDMLLPYSKQISKSLPTGFKTIPVSESFNFPKAKFALVYSNKSKRHPLHDWLKTCLIDCVADAMQNNK